MKTQLKNSVRIIGGTLKGRLVPILPIQGLRPTPNRVRETVFNWLNPFIKESYCLDLFCGSGALGLEAISRGATKAHFIDKELTICKQLNSLCQAWNIAEKVSISNCEIPSANLSFNTPFNIIFLDPPFYQQQLVKLLIWLNQQNWITVNTLIYCECEKELSIEEILPNFYVLKNKTAGQVQYSLGKFII